MISTQDFLRRFGSPLVISLTDIKGVNSFEGWHKHHNTAVLSKINKDETTPYWLFFTPNGNYWSIQQEWQKISRSKETPGPAPYYNALIVDIDIKDIKNKYPTMEELRLHIDEVLSKITIHPTAIVESWWGFHLYRMLKEEDRQAIHDIYGNKIFAISRFMATLFDWWDTNSSVVRWDINGVIRLPWSNHWKTGKPIPVKIVWYSEENFIDLQCIEDSLKQIGEVTKTISVAKDAAISVGTTKYYETSQVKIAEIIYKLWAYPRLYKGEEQTFRLEWTHICIVDKDWNVDRTDSYRTWPAKNCVHCFLKDKYTIEERPRWEPRSFAYHYFHKNSQQTRAFFTKEFNIEFEKYKKDEVETVIQTFAGRDYFVELTDRRVIMHKQIKSWKKMIDTNTDIFRKPIKIIGKSWTKFHANGTECEDEQMVYVMELEIDGKIVNKLLYRLPSKKRFNEKYAWSIFYYGEDNDLWMWYEAMDISDLPTVQVTVLSGLYKNSDWSWTVILWGKVIYWNPGLRYFTPAFELKTKISEEISLKEFYRKFNEIYDAEVAVPLFLQFIALCGMNIWEGTTVYPGMLVSWKTWCWKSSIAEILKNMAGYTASDRKVALPQITPQPLKIMFTDNSILFPDELTLNVGEKAEESCRNGINRDKGARGIGWDNAYYNFRAPLFFTWERTFKDESLNNRLAVIILSEKYWKKDGKDKVIDIKNYSCIKNIYDWYFGYKRNINELQAEKVSMLVKAGIKPRNADVRAYIFTVNEVFQFWFEEDELIKIVKTHLQKMWFGGDDDITDEWELQMYLSKILFARQAQCVKEQYKNKSLYRFMFMDDTAYEKARWSLTTLVNSINAYWERIHVSKNWITIVVKELNSIVVDQVLEKIMEFVLSCNSKVIQYVNRDSEEWPYN